MGLLRRWPAKVGLNQQRLDGDKTQKQGAAEAGPYKCQKRPAADGPPDGEY
jgi:hypothetical protein